MLRFKNYFSLYLFFHFMTGVAFLAMVEKFALHKEEKTPLLSFLQGDVALGGLLLEKKLLTKEKLSVENILSVEPDTKPEETVDMNFDSVSLSDIVKTLAKKRGFDLLVAKELDNIKASLKSSKSLSLAKAWDNVLTLLEYHGFMHSVVGGVHKIVPVKDAPSEPVPLFSSAQGIEPEDLPDTEEEVRYIYFVKNIKVDLATSILEKILSDRVFTIADIEVLILRGRSLRIKHAMKIIKDLDTSGLAQSVSILPLQYAFADKVAKILNEEIVGRGRDGERIRFANSSKKSVHYFSSDVKIIPDKEKNSLILIGLADEIERIIGFVRVAFDSENSVSQSRVHVKDVKYHEPSRVQKMIQKLVASSGPANQKRFFKDNVTVMAESPSSSKASGKYSVGNRLIIACSSDDWTRLEEFIDRIDKPRPQVVLEVMVVDASLDFSRALDGHMLDRGTGILGNDFAWTMNNYADSLELQKTDNITQNRESPLIIKPDQVVNGSMMTFGYTDKDSANSGAWGFIRSMITNKNASIISQPFAVTNNFEETYFETKSTRRVEGEIAASNYRTTIKQVSIDATTSVRITPRVNTSGIVDLDINVAVGDFIENSSVDGQPERQSRNLSTRATMALGEVLVLGGFSKKKLLQSEHKVPLLGSIPIVGNLLKGKSRNSTKSNIYLFIRPSVIKPKLHADPDDYTALKIKYANYQIQNVNTYAQSKDPIERFYFKPRTQSIKEAVKAHKSGRFKYIDDFAERRDSPPSADLANDPYYRPDNSEQRLAVKHSKEKLAMPTLNLKTRTSREST